MSVENKTRFHVDIGKCTGCRKCVSVCSGMVLEMKNGHPSMKPFDRFGWQGCWKCQHCLAVCPAGAISIFGKKPEDSLPLPDGSMGTQMERLLAGRRTCRRYLDRNVDPEIIDRILRVMESAPTGGNACGVEYTVIDDKDRVRQIRDIAYRKMELCAREHRYTSSFNAFYYRKMKESEKTVRKNDMLFCGAPHLFIAHQKCAGKWADDAKADCNLASAYFELAANSFGLGTAMMSYSAEVLNELAPEAKEMLGIPKDHYMGLIIGFGYPEITYARGVQKDRKTKIHRYSERRI